MRWSYKTVHFELKKEGLLGSSFLDESEVEQSLNEYGKSGWELVSMLETMDGLIAVFKQPLSLDNGNERLFSAVTSPPRPSRTVRNVAPAGVGDDHTPPMHQAPVSEPFEKLGEIEVSIDEDGVEGVVILDESSIVEEEPMEERARSDTKKDIGDIKIE